MTIASYSFFFFVDLHFLFRPLYSWIQLIWAGLSRILRYLEPEAYGDMLLLELKTISLGFPFINLGSAISISF